MRNIRVLEGHDYPNVLVNCIGYESRSTAALYEFLENGGAKKRVISFDYRANGGSYEENRRVFHAAGSDTHGSFDEYLNALKAEFSATNAQIAFDITSFDRNKLARVLQLFFTVGNETATIELIYYPQKFREPDRVLEEVLSFGPVTPAFIGVADPDNSKTHLILGAGFEYGRAVSAIDLLEPDHTLCYTPVGSDPRFEGAIRANNLNFSFLTSRDQLLPYYIDEPKGLFFELMSAISSLSHKGSVLILPLGPKIFAAISIVAALCHHPNVMVWRHSVNEHESTGRPDAFPNGDRISFRFALADVWEGRS